MVAVVGAPEPLPRDKATPDVAGLRGVKQLRRIAQLCPARGARVGAPEPLPRDKATPGGADLRGFKQLRRIAKLFHALHDSGCARDTAGNRELHFDDYVILILLFLFNPMIDSMRALQ